MTKPTSPRLSGDRWIEEKPVSKITGRALQSLRNDRSLNRGIPYYKIGKSVRYKESEVREWMERHRVETR